MRVTVSGDGSLGPVVAAALVRAGHAVRVAVRNPGEFRSRSWENRVEVVAADVLDPNTMVPAVEDSQAMIHCTGFASPRFAARWKAASNLLEWLASETHFVLPAPIWAYAPAAEGRIGPDHDKRSPARAGVVQADLEKAILEAGGTVVHLPDLYGLGTESEWLKAAFDRARLGKTVWFPGDLDRPVEFLYAEDAARALLAPLGRRAARGAEYTAPGPRPTTPRGFITRIFRAVRVPARLRSVPILVLRAAYLLDPKRRSLRELLYLHQRSILLDGSAIRRDLSWAPEVSYAEGIRRTLSWLRRSPAGGRKPDRGAEADSAAAASGGAGAEDLWEAHEARDGSEGREEREAREASSRRFAPPAR